MPVFRLTNALLFPPCHYAEPDGLLAIGGDLSPERLLLAYRQGIFPWYSEHTPILWWSPDPRLVLFPQELKIAKSLQRVIKKNIFRVTIDKAFRNVILQCAEVRRKQGEGTWLVPEMIDAYCLLHRLGYAHSVESWYQGELVGGLYGVALGRVFFGESMFAARTDASKVALVYLVNLLRQWQFKLIDCQVTTHHLMTLGAREIPREDFLEHLTAFTRNPAKLEVWISGELSIQSVQ
ncbi:MAG: leucyl/phenylalanyl-tRNA--protein transferase [Desulforhabdus sp.]|jgi:leucyl/phenylalanyl-tRNA--protein transferase|nr:leucyl/phenylalanyl-tRNA--protein transferase [Desulforhabdus sp.]